MVENHLFPHGFTVNPTGQKCLQKPAPNLTDDAASAAVPESWC